MLSKNQIKLIRSLELKKNRRREGLFVAEGPKVVGDLLSAGFTARAIFATSINKDNMDNKEQPFGLATDVGNNNKSCPKLSQLSLNITLITDDELRRISFLQHPQQVLALFEIPDSHDSKIRNEELEIRNYDMPESSNVADQGNHNSQLSLALDGVQDPGNVGTIIRIADWFGIDTIYCSPDTADVYAPKVVQATMGSLAHVRVIYTDLPTLLSHADCPVYGTLLDGEDIYSQELSHHGIIVMGNEGNGISDAVRPLVTHRLLIPNYHRDGRTAESLNVAIATAITCAEFRRR